MAIGFGKGGEENEGWSNTNTNMTTNQNETSSTTQSGTQDTNQSSIVMPIAPAGFEAAWRAANPSGVDLREGYWGDAAKRSSHTTAMLGQLYPDLYKNIDPVVAQEIKAQQGSEFRNEYLDPYLNEVVDATLANYDENAKDQYNMLRSQNGGAFGNNRFGVSQGQFARGSALDRATLDSGLRSQGFNLANQFGMSDAERFFGASAANAANKLAADTFNNNMLQRQREFDVNAAYQGDQMRDNAAKNAALAAAGKVGLNLDWLKGGTPLIGQQGDTTSRTISTLVSDIIRNLTSNATGNSTTNSRSSGTSTQGGVSIG